MFTTYQVNIELLRSPKWGDPVPVKVEDKKAEVIDDGETYCTADIISLDYFGNLLIEFSQTMTALELD